MDNFNIQIGDYVVLNEFYPTMDDCEEQNKAGTVVEINSLKNEVKVVYYLDTNKSNSESSTDEIYPYDYDQPSSNISYNDSEEDLNDIDYDFLIEDEGWHSFDKVIEIEREYVIKIINEEVDPLTNRTSLIVNLQRINKEFSNNYMVSKHFSIYTDTFVIRENPSLYPYFYYNQEEPKIINFSNFNRVVSIEDGFEKVIYYDKPDGARFQFSGN